MYTWRKSTRFFTQNCETAKGQGILNAEAERADLVGDSVTSWPPDILQCSCTR